MFGGLGSSLDVWW